MTAIILFPTNDGGYEYVNIYRADSLNGTYSKIITIPSAQYEYEDVDGAYYKHYKIAWFDGTNETSSLIPVQSSIQSIIRIIRVEFKIDKTLFPDNDIADLFESAKTDIKVDITKFYYGIELTKLSDGIYKIPSRFYFDRNFGGKFSLLDFDLFKQCLPLTEYSVKIPVTAYSVDVYDYWIRTEVLSSNEILKMCFHATGRPLSAELIYKLVAYRICINYYNALYTKASSSTHQQVKIGDISISSGTTSTVNALSDTINKLEARYKKLIDHCRSGFIRSN